MMMMMMMMMTVMIVMNGRKKGDSFGFLVCLFVVKKTERKGVFLFLFGLLNSDTVQ